MSRPRPYIPLRVRVQVAERQARGTGIFWSVYLSAQEINPWPLGQRLRVLLNDLFPNGGCQLDHDPALILRRFSKRTGKYTPAANDPDHLVYRQKDDHLQKTTGRKPGAAKTVTTKGSDIGLKTKFARLERKRKIDTSDIPETKKKWFKGAKVKIPSRPFQKGRKFR